VFSFVLLSLWPSRRVRARLGARPAPYSALLGRGVYYGIACRRTLQRNASAAKPTHAAYGHAASMLAEPRDKNSLELTLTHVYSLQISPQPRQTLPSSSDVDERRPASYRRSTFP
jgi:hypothetical protein